jgi:putative toxin-antitoxin system antitoxin component (TIGR02293 family)
MAAILVTRLNYMELLLETESTDGGFGLVDQARQGVSRGRVDEIAQPVNLTDKDMARILNLSERTLHRLRPDARLDSNASERLLLLENLLAHGLDVFDGRASVLSRWLRIPLPELRRQAPLDLLDTATGFGLVHTVLGRIEHGIYA